MNEEVNMRHAATRAKTAPVLTIATILCGSFAGARAEYPHAGAAAGAGSSLEQLAGAAGGVDAAASAPDPGDPVEARPPAGPRAIAVWLRSVDGFSARSDSARVQKLQAQASATWVVRQTFVEPNFWGSMWDIITPIEFSWVPCPAAGYSCAPGDSLLLARPLADLKVSPDHIVLPRGFVEREALFYIERAVTVGRKRRTYKLPLGFELVVYPLGG